LLFLAKLCRFSITYFVAISLHIVFEFHYVLCCCITICCVVPLYIFLFHYILYCRFFVYFLGVLIYTEYLFQYRLCCFCCFISNNIYKMKKQENIKRNSTIRNENATQYTLIQKCIMKQQHNTYWNTNKIYRYRAKHGIMKMHRILSNSNTIYNERETHHETAKTILPLNSTFSTCFIIYCVFS
jgi:hypothetical protein